jgi:hypothetical protein
MSKRKAFYAEEDDLNDGSDSDDSQDGYVPRARARRVHYIPEERITVASDRRLNSTMSSIPTPASPAKKSRVTLKPDVPAGPAFSPQEWEADFAEFDAEFGPGMQTSGPRKLRDSVSVASPSLGLDVRLIPAFFRMILMVNGPDWTARISSMSC